MRKISHNFSSGKSAFFCDLCINNKIRETNSHKYTRSNHLCKKCPGGKGKPHCLWFKNLKYKEQHFENLKSVTSNVTMTQQFEWLSLQLLLTVILQQWLRRTAKVISRRYWGKRQCWMGGVTVVETDDKSDGVRHDIVVYQFQFLPTQRVFHSSTRAPPQTVRVVTLHTVVATRFYLLLIKSFALLWLNAGVSCHGI